MSGNYMWPSEIIQAYRQERAITEPFDNPAINQGRDQSVHPAVEPVSPVMNPTTGNIQTNTSLTNSLSMQPDLYYQLASILETEIWSHNQTRAELVTELNRRCLLEGQVLKLTQEIGQWKKACETVYETLNEHRAVATGLRQELEDLGAEVTGLREMRLAVDSVEHDDAPIKEEILQEKEVHEPMPRAPHQYSVWAQGEGESAQLDTEVDSWSIDFLREVQEHLRMQECSDRER